MQIAGFQKVKSISKAIVSGVMLSMPLNACHSGKNLPESTIVAKNLIQPAKDSIKIAPREVKKESKLTKEFPRHLYSAPKGHMVEAFDHERLWNLFDKFFDSSEAPKKYTFPIDTAHKPYIAADGIFGAPRGILPNFGIDISIPKKDSTQKAVAVLAPLQGVIVKQKAPLGKAGIQETKIMGTDGKIYVFRFPVKASDYDKERFPVFQKIGTPVNAGDTLGLIANIPNKNSFKLHMQVEDLPTREFQLETNLWQGLKTYFQVPIEGQVNPLDSAQAGSIANILNQYKVEKGKVLPIVKELEYLE